MIKTIDMYVSTYVTTARRNLLTRMIQNLSVKNLSYVLDVGCGRGHFLSMYGWPRTESLIAIDIRPGVLTDAKSKLPDKDFIHVLCCDAHFLPLRNECMDLIVCQELLEHLVDPRKGLNEMFRTLKCKSLMLITVPFLWDCIEPRRIFNLLLSASLNKLKNGKKALLLKLIFKDAPKFRSRQFIPFGKRLANHSLKLYKGLDPELHKHFLLPLTWRKIIEESGMKVEKMMGIAFWLCVLFTCRKS